MAEEKFKIIEDWESLSKEDLKSYITDLHEYLLNFDALNVKRLVISLDNVVGKMADDIDRINSGDIAFPDYTFEDDKGKEKTIKGASKLEIIGNDSIMSNITTMIKMIDDFSEVSLKAAALRPEVAEAAKKQQRKLTEGNAIEQIQEEKWNQRKKS